MDYAIQLIDDEKIRIATLNETEVSIVKELAKVCLDVIIFIKSDDNVLHSWVSSDLLLDPVQGAPSHPTSQDI